ncbi:YegP family protein [Pseudoalteromonas ardens]|uniref:YegP family protein n=1 Tax=Pseudoalteromonas ardens TaxID=3048490 RepID=UPI0009E422F3
MILESEGYVSSQGADKGIASCRINNSFESNYQRLSSRINQPYFVLKTGNQKVIGVSQVYSSVQAMETGVDAVKRYGPKALLIKRAS